MKRPVNNSPIFDYLLTAVVSLLLIVKFIIGYLTLAASIIAVYVIKREREKKGESECERERGD